MVVVVAAAVVVVGLGLGPVPALVARVLARAPVQQLCAVACIGG